MVQSLYHSGFSLEINGASAPQDLMENIQQISVEESLHLPAMFTIVIYNPLAPGKSDQKMWNHAPSPGSTQKALLQIGSEVQIGFTSSATESSDFPKSQKGYLLKGEITSVEAHFTSGSQAPMIVRGYDRSHRLHRGRHNRSFQEVTDSELVTKIVREAGLMANVTSTSVKHEYVFQENQTNMEFLRERAARLGFELFMQDDKLHFRKPTQTGSISLKWLKELTSFQVRVTSAEQVSDVEVRGWDYTQKKVIVETAQPGQTLTETGYGQGSKASAVFQSKPKLIVTDQPVYSAAEAQAMAQALATELSDEFVHADAQTIGMPSIRPGRVVELKDLGNYSGKYYITGTRHTYSAGSYTTAFSVRGLRGGDLLSLLNPPTRLESGQTLLLGIVTDNKDPKGWGRVRVKFPTLTEDHTSNWARVVAPGAGKSRGFDCLPEINDEVLVGFEHGDIHRPFVIGGLWNGKDAPPEKVDDSVVGGQVRTRTFKSRTGNSLQLIDEDKGSSKKGIVIKSVDGHQIYVNDADKVIEIKTSGGHTVKLDDRGKAIELKTTSGHTCKLDDAGAKISIESKGNLSIQAAGTLEIKANGIVSIKGAMIQLNC